MAKYGQKWYFGAKCELGPIRPDTTSYGLDESFRLELYLISLLVNFSCELGQIMMTRYNFLWTR